MKRRRWSIRRNALILVAGMLLTGMPVSVRAAENTVEKIEVDADRLICGTKLQDGEGDFRLEDEDSVEVDPGSLWVESYDKNDPDQHQALKGKVEKQASKAEDGLKTRICELCGAKEEEVLPRITLPFTKVYEPKTSWSMAATIAWNADETVMHVAGKEVRPATVFVHVDRNLSVYDRNGRLISSDITSFAETISKGMIPAFYISDKAAADALKAWLSKSGLVDCFVVARPEHKDLVKDVADLLYVRGMLDYSDVKQLTTKDLTDMVAAVNGAHGKDFRMCWYGSRQWPAALGSG